jgi:hypothetical protein
MLIHLQQVRVPLPYEVTEVNRMPVKRRSSKKRSAVSQHEEAWLRGDRDSGFVQFKRDEELQELWDRHGDHGTMYWEPGMSGPEEIERPE